MTISITIDGESAVFVRQEMARLLGALGDVPVVGKVPQPPIPDEQIASVAETLEADAEARAEGQNIDGTERRETTTAAPIRERGKPSAGHARRTKAEIAEDDAFMAGVNKEMHNVFTAGAGGIQIVSETGVTAEERPLISTDPENRVGPEDTAEDQEQDAADETAETAAGKTDGKLTLEDVRNGMGVYVQKFGMEAIQVDGQEVFKRILGECTLKDDKGAARGWKVSDLPDDQAVLKRIVDGFAELTTKNPFNRSAKAA